jgi:glycosyltransferase involved in cell wall biosynthesis
MAGAPLTGQRATAPPPTALVYGNISMNLIQGATSWLASITEVLTHAGCTVTLVLNSPVHHDLMLAPLLRLPGVRVCRPYEERLISAPGRSVLSDEQAARVLREIDAEHPYELVLLRGWGVAARMAADPSLDGRLWTYLTDIPQSVPLLTAEAAASLARIARASRYLLCQTEGLRCFLEESIPEACGKCMLVPPMVPTPAATRPDGPPGGGPLRLVYTGKFAPRWNTFEMVQLARLLAARGVRAQLHVAGAKFHQDPADPGYQRRMRSALGQPHMVPPEPSATGVIWHGSMTRQEAMTLAASCDIGLGWLHEDLDASLELSTKILEFGSMGLPVILNRSLAHEDLLGTDYPLYARGVKEAADAVELAAGDPGVFQGAARAMAAAAERFSLAQAVRRFRGYLDQAFPAPLAADKAAGERAATGRAPTGDRPAGGSEGTVHRDAGRFTPASPLRVVVAGHNLRFFTLLREHLEYTPGIEIRVDEWPELSKHDPLISKSAADWADVVICEWCGPNAVWYSRNKRRGSRLLVRLHRFEAARPFPRQVRISAVDQVICVSGHYARTCQERFGWPAGKITVVPNAIDTAQFDRPKLDGAEHHLGMIGMAPSRKRPDLALDLLEELRRDDDSYLLFIKSWLPWNHDWWVWKHASERDYYTALLRRIQRSPLLREAVVFDEAGPDVAAWLRRVGFILSTSDDEGSHVAVSEGMASGAVPVLRHWHGAENVYDDRWIHDDPERMAASVAALRGRAWQRAGAAAQLAAQPFSRQAVQAAWRTLLTANLPSAVRSPGDRGGR